MTTHRPSRNGALLLAASCFATLVHSAPTTAVERPTSICNFGAFVAETDPAGLKVRAAPDPRAKVLGTLPPTFIEPSAGYGVRVEVDVAGARNGWFLIRNASDNEALTDRPARPMFSGEGWVSGSRLTVKSQADVGRAGPSPKAVAVLRIGDNETFDNDIVIEAGRLADCNGKWAQVEFADQRFPAKDRRSLKIDAAARAGLPPGRFRAWVNRICAIQETSCDGLAGDEAADATP
ncbi:SH3 domain-containing protein [Mitsuaria sp. 7]|uniref:SH3 domain-containing protein n=1 Tax=Mitsuaria sp. 7 TaxID=1658665 RepID=UPI0007DE22EB|nr:SH3 domain-containing protein [Mitsuaria sp. 7]ANH68257.1 hypothetical protein ABE85_13045 [Mitsuaria sp. 7]